MNYAFFGKYAIIDARHVASAQTAGLKLRVADRRLAIPGHPVCRGMVVATRALRPAFSLAELMIAIGVLGIGMLIIAAAFPVALDQSRQALELSTSQMVFNEAVNNLKTKITWVQLEKYIVAPPAQLPPVGTIYPINFAWADAYGPIFPNFRQDPNPTGPVPSDLAYSVDRTYGWMAAVERVSDQCYKFWIFVIREPTDVQMANAFKFQWAENPNVRPNPVATATNPPATGPVYSNQLVFPIAAGNPQFPGRETRFLANNGQLYTITDYSPASTTVTAACDKSVSDGIVDTIAGPPVQPNPANIVSEVTDIAYLTRFVGPGAGQTTRKNPVVAVYQTVISY